LLLRQNKFIFFKELRQQHDDGRREKIRLVFIVKAQGNQAWSDLHREQTLPVQELRQTWVLEKNETIRPTLTI